MQKLVSGKIEIDYEKHGRYPRCPACKKASVLA